MNAANTVSFPSQHWPFFKKEKIIKSYRVAFENARVCQKFPARTCDISHVTTTFNSVMLATERVATMTPDVRLTRADGTNAIRLLVTTQASPSIQLDVSMKTPFFFPRREITEFRRGIIKNVYRFQDIKLEFVVELLSQLSNCKSV